MWENFHQPSDLLPFQKQIFSYLQNNWSSQRRLQITCTGHIERDKALVAFLIAHRLPTLMLCHDRTRQAYWLDLIKSFLDESMPDDMASSLVRIPNLSEDLSPFSVMTYSSLCQSASASPELRQQAREHWERSMAFAPIDSSKVLSFGDLDAIHDTSEVLGDTALRNVSIYMDGIQNHLSPLDGQNNTVNIHNWLSSHVDNFIDEFKKGGLQVVLCDESHKLEGLSIEFVNYLRTCLPMVHLIGVSPTAIDFSSLTLRAVQLHKDLFSSKGLEIDAPSLVKDGCHSPYRELLMIVEPSQDETTSIENFLSRFKEAFTKVDDKGYVTATIGSYAEHELALMSNDAPGFWARRNEFLRSLLHYYIYTERSFASVWKPYIQSFSKSKLEDMLVFIREYIFHVLMDSDEPQDRRAGESLIQALRPLGITLTEGDIYFSENMVPNILAHSTSKVTALVEVLEAEMDAMGEDLSALILTDFNEYSVSYNYFPDTEYNFSSCGSLDVLDAIIDSPVTKHLNPIAVTGHSMVIDSKFEAFFRKEMDAWQNHYEGLLHIHMETKERHTVIKFSGPGWNYNLWAEMLISFLEGGLSSCIIGTRLLLNSHWDKLHVNSLFNLTSTESNYVADKLHARMQRYTEQDTGQASHLWDFMCVKNDVEFGLSDYERLSSRKGQSCCICEDGEFEYGVGHLYPLSSEVCEIKEDDINAVRREMLDLVKERRKTYDQWKESKLEERRKVQTFEFRLSHGAHADEKRRFSLRQGQEIVEEKRTLVDFYKGVCRALAQSIIKFKGLKCEASSCRFEFKSRRQGAYRMYYDVPEEIEKEFIDLLEETFAPIDRQHYVIAAESHQALELKKGFFGGLFGGKKEEDQSGDMTLLAVPKIFKDKKHLREFTIAWQTHVSVQTPKANRLEEARRQNASYMMSDGALYRPSVSKKELWR